MWLTAAAPARHEAQSKEVAAKQRQLSELAEEAKGIFGQYLDALKEQLDRIEEIRFDESNPQGIVSADVQRKAQAIYNQVQKGIDKIGEMVGITTHHYIPGDNPYTKAYKSLAEVMKSFSEYFRKLSQPIDQRTAKHGILDQEKSRRKGNEFIQKYHPEPRPKPWPSWLRSMWHNEKPSEQYSSAQELIARIQSAIQQAFQADPPQLGFHIEISPSEFLAQEETKKKREQAAKQTLAKPQGIPDNVKRMHEVFYPEGIQWHIEPEVPQIPPPHKEKRTEYAYPHQRPGWTPRPQVR